MKEDDDELNEEEEDKEDRVTWGKRKGQFYSADQVRGSNTLLCEIKKRITASIFATE